MTQQNQLQSMFQAPPQQGAPGPAGYPAAAPTQSVYDMTDTGKDRFPRPQPGKYRLRVKQSGEQQTVSPNGYRGDPYFFVDFEVVQVLSGGAPFRTQDAPTVAGSVVHFDQCISDRALTAAAPRMNAMFLAVLQGINPALKTIQDVHAALPGIKRAAGGHATNNAAGQPYPVNPLQGLEVFCTVTLGDIATVKDPANSRNRIPDPEGDRYRNWSWEAVPPGA